MSGKVSKVKGRQREFEKEIKLFNKAVKRELKRLRSLNHGEGKDMGNGQKSSLK